MRRHIFNAADLQSSGVVPPVNTTRPERNIFAVIETVPFDKGPQELNRQRCVIA